MPWPGVQPNEKMIRVSPQEFRSLPLEVHALLHDVRLHDVSAVDLPGGGEGRTIADVQSLIAQERLVQANPIVSALFRLRRAVRRLSGGPRSNPKCVGRCLQIRVNASYLCSRWARTDEVPTWKP
jgi:hypothetical protein